MTDNEHPKLPDLQQWIAAAGGYDKIDRQVWDAAIAQFKDNRRETLVREILGNWARWLRTHPEDMEEFEEVLRKLKLKEPRQRARGGGRQGQLL